MSDFAIYWTNWGFLNISSEGLQKLGKSTEKMCLVKNHLKIVCWFPLSVLTMNKCCPRWEKTVYPIQTGFALVAVIYAASRGSENT